MRYNIGILGGGQLARMSVMAAQRLGVSAVTLDLDPHSPAAQVGPSRQGSIHDATAIAAMMAKCDKITFENEFIRAETLRLACAIANFDPANVIPGIDSIEKIQDKFLQREAYLAAGAPTPKAVRAADAAEIGFPLVLKARYGGYDGKGTKFIASAEEYEQARSVWSDEPWLAEEFVDFKQELAVMVVSKSDGSISAFPAMVTEQRKHVCDLVYPLTNPEIAEQARSIAVKAVRAVNGVGLFGVELFQTQNNEIQINEIAPRPHNSGHYTLDWGGTSQFEAHIQVVAGMFGNIQVGQPTCMANLLGIEEAGDFQSGLRKLALQHPEARFHWYGKTATKPGRKMGHLNVVSSPTGSPSDIVDHAIRSRKCFYAGWIDEVL